MKKELKDEITDFWSCGRCEIDSLGDGMCPCPRGSCDALHMGEVIVKTTIVFNVTKWLHQYLSGEKLHYLVEIHPDEGVITELFFKEWDECLEYIIKHDIKLTYE